MRFRLVGSFVLAILFSPAVLSAAERIAVIYDSDSKIYRLVHDGIKSRLGHGTSIDIRSSDISEIKDSDYDLIISIGKKNTDVVLNRIKKTPVVFSLVSAPKYFGYHESDNVTGVSMDVPSQNFFEPLSRLFPAGGKIGFVYKSNKSNYITSQIELLEGKYKFRSIRRQVRNTGEFGDALKEQITKHKIKAFWMVSDSLYNKAVFDKLAKVCKKYNVLLIANFQPLVTEAGAALAIAPNYFDVGVQTADVAEAILGGKKPGDIPIQVPRKTGIYINPVTLKQMTIKLPASVLNVERITKLFDQAQAQYRKGEIDSAKKTLNEILKLDRRHDGAIYISRRINARAALNQGKKLLADNQPKRAIPLLIQASVYFNEAKTQLRNVREKLKPEINKIIQTSKVSYANKQYKSVIENSSLVLSLDPDNQEARILLQKARKKYQALSALQ